MSSGISDWQIYRTYKCLGCKGEIGVIQKASDPWVDQCPLCGVKDEMIIKSAQNKSLSVQIDSNKPKTIGTLAEKNTERDLKRGLVAYKQPEKTPWWRKDKVNFDVLKNPQGYIETGRC